MTYAYVRTVFLLSWIHNKREVDVLNSDSTEWFSGSLCAFTSPSIVHLSLGDRIAKEKLRKSAAGASEYQFICYHPYVAGAILTAKELTSTWFLRQNSSVYAGHCVRRNWLAVCYSPGFSPISTGNGNQQMDKEGVERGSWLGKKTKREESIFYGTVGSCDVTTHAKPGKSLDFSRRLLVLSSI
jgi:hypothetical protein